MNSKYLEHIANIENLNTYDYKILLLLLTKPYTQAELTRTLNILPQNMNKYIRKLDSLGLIEVSKVEGRNKFYTAVTNLSKLQDTLKGQIRLISK